MTEKSDIEENIINKTDEEVSEENIEDIEKVFKEMVINWVKIDDKIRVINDELKDLKSEKKQFEDYILGVMDKMDEDTVTLSNGLLKKNVSQSKGSIKEELIQEAINEITKDADKAYEMTQYIIQKRPISEKIALKRTIRRDNKNKKK